MSYGTNTRKWSTKPKPRKARFISGAKAAKSRWLSNFDEPDKKYVVYSGGKVQVYQPKIGSGE